MISCFCVYLGREHTPLKLINVGLLISGHKKHVFIYVFLHFPIGPIFDWQFCSFFGPNGTNKLSKMTKIHKSGNPIKLIERKNHRTNALLFPA